MVLMRTSILPGRRESNCDKCAMNKVLYTKAAML
ncbi:hypothetical protein KM92DES2_10929 [uncultured Desulfovibrio sp.]|uniref:Uncharacterized protein n=1 Tax=uncultured Desulfovibrio sp. TaxID=167968 RepID=A0A212JDE9_9BACT|nr:hypothetical protein KM92DES2_10929 [uncultured Desulfovibrio sp.]